MREHLRFSVVYWHTMRGRGSDMFGAPTMNRPWDDNSDSLDNARRRVRVAFEFIEKLGAPFYAFHDRDVAPEGATLARTNKNLDAVAKVLKEEQQRTGIGLLWGTACFSRIRASLTARPPVATPMCLPTPPRRSRRRWK
jgi:xylose isomerase